MKLFLVIVVAAVVAATAAMIIVGSRTFERTVVKDPYETGLQWDKMQRQRQESGWNVVFLSRHAVAGRNDIVLSARDHNGRPLSGATVVLTLEGPPPDEVIRESPATQGSEGNFYAVIDVPQRGPWMATITVTRDGKTIKFEETLHVE